MIEPLDRPWLHASRDAGAPEEVLRLWFDQRSLSSEALHLSCRPAEHVAVGCHCRVLQVQDPWNTMCPSLGKGNRARPRNSHNASYGTRFKVFAKISAGVGGPARDKARTRPHEYASAGVSGPQRILATPTGRRPAARLWRKPRRQRRAALALRRSRRLAPVAAVGRPPSQGVRLGHVCSAVTRPKKRRLCEPPHIRFACLVQCWRWDDPYVQGGSRRIECTSALV